MAQETYPHSDDTRYACIWGNWMLAPNIYKPNAEIHKLEDFTEDQGYEPEDIEAIKKLDLDGNWYDCPLGNHRIMRIS